MGRKGDYKPKQDLTGKKFGKLTVISYAGYKTGKTGNVYHQWNCLCDCGNYKIATTPLLNSGHCRSCGCLPHKPLSPHKTHGKSHDNKLYDIWRSMKGRCYTPSNSAYKHYGARGIQVCEEWRNDFETFYQWSMANGYDFNADRKEISLDRIDVNGDYSPDNCRWTDIITQANNKTDTKRHLINGEYLTVSEIASRYGVSAKLLRARIHNGMSVEKALNKDYLGTAKYFYTFNGEKHTIPEWSKITGIKEITIRARLHRGWDIEKTLTAPLDMRGINRNLA